MHFPTPATLLLRLSLSLLRPGTLSELLGSLFLLLLFLNLCVYPDSDFIMVEEEVSGVTTQM